MCEYACVSVCVHAWMFVCEYMCVCVHACKCINKRELWIFGLFTVNPILTIRRPTHELIRRFVSVHAVKTRRRFEPEATSFHVSVCFYVISLFSVVNEYLCFTRIISCDRLIYFTIMITRIISWDISECSLWLYSLSECLSISFHVIVGCHYGSGLVVVYSRLWLDSIYWSAGLIHILG